MNNQLALMQLADSFFPSGSFTLSHGLEYLVQTKQIKTVVELQNFLQILLLNKIGSCDLVALIHGYRGSQQNNWQLIQNADRQLFSQTLIEKNRQTQQKSGRALLMVAQETWQDKKLEQLQQKIAAKQFYCLHPIVFAVVAEIAGINEQNTALAFLHNLITGLLGAAIRLGVIGHIQAQKTLLFLTSDITTTYQQAKTLKLSEIWSCTPTIDLAQMQHQKLQTRLFAS
ncbi:Urease accessory protein UreF [Hyella patelloides LEGE 07179]|uniref:Urease accessory protein UreF n=1 Tax=Hyella patelloides LEGE 07179 TaxID=945734 RepID=A0A563VIU2_9CYAN|nr:urease accessory UreF family protein [Hyella patelloides]VEP11313.1 Urease accessory protein UreF [Hyella patelloides LEGE 07179]